MKGKQFRDKLLGEREELSILKAPSGEVFTYRPVGFGPKTRAPQAGLLRRCRCVHEYITRCRKLDLAQGELPMQGLRVWLGSMAMAISAAAAQAGEVQVAVSANFAGPLAKIGEGFAAATGHTLKVSAGPTGKFYAQIAAGAPFEVLIAADDETPKKLIAEGLAVAGSNFTYAIGKLVLWSVQTGLVDDQGAVLATGRFAHLAIANPKVAPYGVAALEVLKARGLTGVLTPKLVTGESIAQVYQFVVTGNAELGFVALSQVVLPGRPVLGSYWLVPSTLHRQIRQDAVLLKAGEKNPAAAALLAFLKTAPVRRLIADSGYDH
jgi:molybdate transport system substrate-binding protein